MKRALPALLVSTLLLAALPTAAAVGVEGDPDLKQKLGDLAVVDTARVLDAGHVDMGPKLVDGAWTFLVHDDVAKADPSATSVWRHPDQTVFRVTDDARLAVPDDPAYAFIGKRAGEPVWVVPQTQDRDVVWLGWNTQDPEVMQTIDRGVTLSLTGVEGPGDVSVYLQSGTFGEPQVLWDSRRTGAQPVWVDVNTHTHASWAFTEPGVYLLRLRAEADLLDGSSVSDTQLLRFAVGDDASADAALAARWTGEPEPEATGGDGAVDASAAEETDGSSTVVALLLAAIVIVAVGLVVGFGVALLRGDRARRRVLGGDR